MTSKTPFIVHCGECKHEWTAVYLPMPISDAAAIASSLHCPMCASGPDSIWCKPTLVCEVNTSSKRVKKTGET